MNFLLILLGIIIIIILHKKCTPFKSPEKKHPQGHQEKIEHPQEI